MAEIETWQAEGNRDPNHAITLVGQESDSPMIRDPGLDGVTNNPLAPPRVRESMTHLERDLRKDK